MTENEQTKICPLCAETIKEAAKVCPFCQTRQNRFCLLAAELVSVVVVLLVLVGLPIFCEKMLPAESDETSSLAFVIHRSDLSIDHPFWEANGNKSGDYWLTGLVTNKGSLAWRVHGFELKIFDGKNNLQDVAHPDLNKSEVFVVQPGQEHTFKVRFSSQVLEAGSKLSVRVQKATDGRDHYDPGD
ncbi:MAG: hypothetical protein PHY43_08765 [Verrucomicrobiales bacterium]|nr:hypothetical protein [Verrucomicrobiales bacterium]